MVSCKFCSSIGGEGLGLFKVTGRDGGVVVWSGIFRSRLMLMLLF